MLEEFLRDPIVVEEEVSLEYEITRKIILAGNREIFFKNADGHKVVSNLWADRNKIYSLYGKGQIDFLKEILEATRKRGKLKEGKEIWTEKVTSLEDLPIPKFFPGDGGPYITSSIFISKYEGVVNASYHRMMYVGERKFRIRLVPRHLYAMWKNAKERGEDLPVAIAIGVEPDLAIAASISTKYGINELEIASYLHKIRTGEPLEVTEINGIPVPSKAEYVLFGKITSEEGSEGPFIDVTRTRDRVRRQPTVEIQEAYSSEDPVFHAILPGGYEHQNLMGIPREASIYEEVCKVVPEVFGVRLTEGGGSWLHAIISIRKQHEGDGKNAIMAAFTGHPSLKRVIVVDEDVDVFNDSEVEWAIATRVRPDLDLLLIKGARGSTLDPSSEDGMMTKWGIDATAPISEKEKYKDVFKEVL